MLNLLLIVMLLLLMVHMLQHALVLVLLQVLCILLWWNAKDRGVETMHLLVPLPVCSGLLIHALLSLFGRHRPLSIPGVLEELVDSRYSIALILRAITQRWVTMWVEYS